MSDFRELPLFRFGNEAQIAVHIALQAKKRLATEPFYKFQNDEEDTGPCLEVPNPPLPTICLSYPDIAAGWVGKTWDWYEVKRKSVPVWWGLGAEWRHGMDESCFQDYLKVKRFRGGKLYIIICESYTPVDPNRDSDLVPGCNWLAIEVKGSGFGVCDPGWPGGRGDPRRRGRKGEGGRLWPRNAMRSTEEVLGITLPSLSEADAISTT